MVNITLPMTAVSAAVYIYIYVKLLISNYGKYFSETFYNSTVIVISVALRARRFN